MSQLTQSATTIAKGVSPNVSDVQLQETENDVKQKAETDDWSIDTISSDTIKLPVPSFIRLFMIHRILCKKLANKNDDAYQSLLSALTTVLDDSDEKKIGEDIVTRLIQSGIKSYMEKYYNEKEQSQLIESIMTKVIFKQFSNEYEKEIYYINENEDKPYQEIVFNTNDIMSKTFQFVAFDHLRKCSLVSSHWLYHTWNINSVYHVNVSKLIVQTTKCQFENIDECNITRAWQRIVNARSLYFDLTYKYKFKVHWDSLLSIGINLMVLNKLSLLGNIERLNGRCKENQILLLQTVLKKCQNKIEALLFQIGDRRGDVTFGISPLKLINVETISFCGAYFHMQWTNNCQELIIDRQRNIPNDWCDYIVKNCDCTGIKTLHMRSLTFNKSIDKSSLEKLAQKFINLTKLQISFWNTSDESVFLLWKLLNPIISKNSGIVELKTSHWFRENSYILLNDVISQAKLKVNKFHFGVGNSSSSIWNPQFKCIQKTLGTAMPESCLEYIRIDNWQVNGHQLAVMVNDFETNYKVSYVKTFKALKVLEIEDFLNFTTACSTIKLVTQFLSLSIIFEKHLFIIANFKISEFDSNDFIV